MELYRRYGPALLRKAERMIGSRAEAEDIVQTVFIDLLRSGLVDRQGDAVGEPIGLPYLYRAVTTRSLNRLRDHRRRQELLDQHGELLLGGAHPGPDTAVITLDLLCRLSDRLDDRSTEILVYRYVDQMTGAEIADLIGVSRRAITKRLEGIRDEVAALAGEGR